MFKVIASDDNRECLIAEYSGKREAEVFKGAVSGVYIVLLGYKKVEVK